MNKVIKRVTIGVTALVIGVLASGCTEKYSEPFQDADRSGVVNSAPVDIVENADGFSNLSTKCDHGNRVYVAYHFDSPYAAIAVVPQDPTC